MRDLSRRGVIGLVGATAAWPVAARAQQSAMPVIGFLSSTAPDMFSERLGKFSQGLKEQGFVEGENLAILYRFADQLWRPPALLRPSSACQAIPRSSNMKTIRAIGTPKTPPAGTALRPKSKIPIEILLRTVPKT